MAVKLRLTRLGAKKKPFYRIVAADSDSPRDGKFIEVVGTYDPNKNPAKADLNEGLVLKWLDRGAVPTETVKNLFKKAGIFNKTSGRLSA
ncbi:MAG: 30S ribosomal protein S16 [Deltaproteobacteria bacterium]|nr:30S ribosomal protein S16 [Deltaproteobacteria bacterium]